MANSPVTTGQLGVGDRVGGRRVVVGGGTTVGNSSGSGVSEDLGGGDVSVARGSVGRGIAVLVEAKVAVSTRTVGETIGAGSSSTTAATAVGVTPVPGDSILLMIAASEQATNNKANINPVTR